MTIQKKDYKLGDFLAVPLKVTPLFTVIVVLNKIISALVPSLTVLVTADFINTALAIFNGNVPHDNIYLPLLLLMVLIAYGYINGVLIGFVTTKMSMKLNEKFRCAIVEKRAKLEYKHIENNDTWDIINRTCADPAGKIFAGFNNILGMASMSIQVASILLILFTQVWWAGIVIIAFSVPLFYISIKSGKQNYDAFREADKHSRRANYLQGILTSRENVEERAMFSYTDSINEKWFEKFEIARKIRLKTEAKNFVRMKSASLITVLISILIIAVLIGPLGSGEINIGMFIGLVNAVFNLVQMMSWELSWVTKEIASSKEYLKDLSLFSELSEQEGALDVKTLKDGFVFKSLEFSNVSFTYPDTEKVILKNCSFKLNSTMHYAFVGINGAGKTTITKLLTGLYDNFEGEIKINDKYISEYSHAELKAMFSVVYQDFAKYYISVRDNIALGNVNKTDDARIEKEIKQIELSAAIDKLPDGINTYLGKIKENGVDLSGGEWQRVAIARSLVSDAPISILDEPTAALDPVAESNIYAMFDRISAGKSTIFITHRLGAAKLADEIIVIDDGKVAEQGNHSALMGKDGIYAKMFESQRSWYA